jgi:hypothetical protein
VRCIVSDAAFCGFFCPLSKPQSISLFLFSSPGIYEAVELRDGGKDYMGKGVSKVRVFAMFPFVCGWNVVCSFVSLRFFPLSQIEALAGSDLQGCT